MVINNNIKCAYIILDNILFLEFVSIVYNISVIIYDYDIGRVYRICICLSVRLAFGIFKHRKYKGILKIRT